MNETTPRRFTSPSGRWTHSGRRDPFRPADLYPHIVGGGPWWKFEPWLNNRAWLGYFPVISTTGLPGEGYP